MTTDTRQMPAHERITRAWQDSAQALAEGYGEQFRRFAEFSAACWQPGRLDRTELSGAVARIAAGLRELAGAQATVAGEWLRAPLWLSGAASPDDLQAGFVRLFEAQRGLVEAYTAAALGWQRAMTGAAEQVTGVARAAADAQVPTARREADDSREAQQATVDAARDAAEAVRETAGRPVQQARAVADHAREATEEAAEQGAPAQRLVKGNVNARGEKIYHVPGQATYERTQAEELFATEEEAQAAGYRRSAARGGGAIKGNINREGERIYHLPGQANYDRIDADMLFESEEQAQAAGFRPAQR
jgi:hypothetical protein